MQLYPQNLYPIFSNWCQRWDPNPLTKDCECSALQLCYWPQLLSFIKVESKVVTEFIQYFLEISVLFTLISMGQHALKRVNNYLNTNIYSYLEISGGQSSNLYLNVVHFLTPVLIRHLWQVKTVVFLHWCLILLYCVNITECKV